MCVLDPRPRVPITHGEAVDLARPVDYVVSSVPPEAAEAVPPLVRNALERDAIFFDWNTVAPEVKLRVRDALPVATVDVALLDSVDRPVERPIVAVSGARVEEAARLLEMYGFDTSIAGDEVGEAAALKYLRSILMKGLEALVLEYTSLASDVPGEPIVRRSLEETLGEQFVRFMDVLVRTNRVHAGRRSRELANAVDTFAANGVKAELVATAVNVLRHAADVWADDSAPPVESDARALAAHLRRTLWGGA